MFTNLMLHLCQSDCLCRCQMYPFNAFYVTYGGNYKRYPSVFDLRAYSTGVSVTMTYIVTETPVHLAIFLMFSQGKLSITLLLHKHFFKRSNIYLLSSTGKRWKTISGHFCATVAAVGRSTTLCHWQFDILRRADVCSLACLKIDGVSGCGVTRYREELRIFVKL